MITLTMMACLNMNGMYFCDERLNTRKEVTVHKAQIEILETMEYRFAKDLSDQTIVKMIYNGKPTIDGDVMNGCRMTYRGKHYFYEFPCKQLRKEIKSQ